MAARRDAFRLTLVGVFRRGVESEFYPSDHGLTLIEVLVAIVVLLVLSGIAIPNIIALNQQFQLSSAANQISGDLQLSRMKAIMQRKRFRVTFDDATETYQVETRPDCSSGGYTPFGPARSLPKNVNIVSVTSDPSFSCIGTAGTGTINLSNTAGRTKSIVVDSVGRVKIQ
jgi:prepilin-type N-terminal cleavage/methylation domain-containing protein